MLDIGGWQKAREFEVEAQGITLRLRVPTALQMRRIVSAHVGESQAAALVQEPLLLASIVGWSGVPGSVIGQDGDLPFDPKAIEAVLDRYTEAADRAYAAVIERFADRRQQFEAAEKN